MRRLFAWLPLLAFVALIGTILGLRFGLVREAVHGAVEQASGKFVPAGTPAPQDSNEVALGRLLFFDPILSSNQRRSCAGCHMPSRALTDGNRVSVAIDRTALPRNAPAILNATDHRAFFWDGRAGSLEEQIDGPVHNKRELGGLTASAIERRLASIPEYRLLFAGAFGASKPRYADTRSAIAAYERTLRSHGSTVDRWWRGEIATTDMPADVREGFQLFAGKAQCSRCHYLPLTTSVTPGEFREQEFNVIGVPLDSTGTALDPDLGRYVVTRLDADRHAFQAPSLRNIAHTAPYMHNGAFATLDEVVRFYNRGGGRGLGFDLPNQSPEVHPLHLTEHEEHALVRFLEALSDDPAALAAVSPPPRVPSGLKPGGEY